MAIKTFEVNKNKQLTFNVDTILDPGTAGSFSATSVLVQAIDIVDLAVEVVSENPNDKGVLNLANIKKMDLDAASFGEFSVVNAIPVSSILGSLVDASTKYPSAPAGTKLYGHNYPLVMPDSLYSSSPSGVVCLRIRTIVLDTAESTSPAIPSTIAGFNTMVAAIGQQAAIHDYHNRYYSCVTIPLHLNTT